MDTSLDWHQRRPGFEIRLSPTQSAFFSFMSAPHAPYYFDRKFGEVDALNWAPQYYSRSVCLPTGRPEGWVLFENRVGRCWPYIELFKLQGDACTPLMRDGYPIDLDESTMSPSVSRLFWREAAGALSVMSFVDVEVPAYRWQGLAGVPREEAMPRTIDLIDCLWIGSWFPDNRPRPPIEPARLPLAFLDTRLQIEL